MYLKAKTLELTHPVILVTGCGSGIGLALAHLLYQLPKYRVIVTAHHGHSVAELKKALPENERFMIHELDVTQPVQRENLIAYVYSKWRAIDVIVNNAGISYRSVIEHMDDESELKQIDTNYLGPMSLLRLVIPSMRENNSGKIINISSVSGMVAMPTMASYSASKHALEGASEALWYELRPYGISVTLVQPGFIKSNSFEKVYASKKAQLSYDLEGPYSEYYSNMGPFIKQLMERSPSTPEKIAQQILQLIQQKNPPLWSSATIDAALFFWIRKLLPRRFFHRIMYFLLPNANKWGEKYKKPHKELHKIAI